MSELDEILSDVIKDTHAPSPVADMQQPEPVVGQPQAQTPKQRGRRPLPRDANGNIIRDGAKPQPQIIGVQAPIDPANAAIEPCAELAVMLVNTSGMMLGGENGAMQQNEALLAKSGFVSYFKAKGVENVPAWVVLAGALAPYYLRVITTTPAKSKISSFFERTYLNIRDFIVRKKNARFNRRDNNVGKDNTSTQVGEQSQE